MEMHWRFSRELHSFTALCHEHTKGPRSVASRRLSSDVKHYHKGLSWSPMSVLDKLWNSSRLTDHPVG